MKSPTNGGKGSDRRPSAISEKEERENWEVIFGKKNYQPPMKTLPEPCAANDKQLGS